MRNQSKALLLAAAVLAHGSASAQLALAPNQPAPPLTGYWHPSLEPHTVDWSEHELTLVAFWADWCEPCKELMPRVQDLYERRAKDGLGVLGVHDPHVTPQQVTEFLAPLNVSYPILRLSKMVGPAWGVGVLPTTFLVDKHGLILRRYAGGARELTDALVRDTERLLDGGTLETIELPAPQPPSGAADHP